MNTLYAVRGVGEWWGSRVWVSPQFAVTMLIKTGIGDWKPQHFDFQAMCYEGFRVATGFVLRPGEYIEINMEVV